MQHPSLVMDRLSARVIPQPSFGSRYTAWSLTRGGFAQLLCVHHRCELPDVSLDPLLCSHWTWSVERTRPPAAGMMAE